MYLYKNLFFSISSVISIPIMLIGINGGYFPAICRVCLFRFKIDLFNSRRVISGANIGLLILAFLIMVFLFRRQDFCYDQMTSQSLQICFLIALKQSL